MYYNIRKRKGKEKMTKEERAKRIEQLEEKRFLINMADFLDEFDKIELKKNN